MFETFAAAARGCVITAREETVLLGHEFIGTEHLLLGLLRQDGDPTAALLAERGLALEPLRAAVRRHVAGTGRAAESDSGALDAEALRSIGIDLAEVTEQVESVFGAGALSASGRIGATATRIRMTKRAKRTLALSLRAARASSRSPRRIECAHLLLGLLREGEGLARKLLLEAGLDLAALERDAEGIGAAEASGPRH